MLSGLKTEFLKVLKSERGKLTKQEYKILKAKAMDGDINGAIKGLDEALRRYLRNFVIKRVEKENN